LSDQAAPERFAGQKVTVKGVLYEKTGIIKVESIEQAKQGDRVWIVKINPEEI
jgi:hypothetical protein